MTMCDQTCQERKINRAISALNRFLSQRSGTAFNTDHTVTPVEGTFLATTAAANAADLILPDPVLFPGREVYFVNYSGASQNILSHDGGTALTIKVVTAGANVGSHAVENATTIGTGRRHLRAINGTWVLLGI